MNFSLSPVATDAPTYVLVQTAKETAQDGIDPTIHRSTELLSQPLPKEMMNFSLSPVAADARTNVLVQTAAATRSANHVSLNKSVLLVFLDGSPGIRGLFNQVYFKGPDDRCVSFLQASRKDDNMDGRKEGNVLFNDALNTFYLRLYCVRHNGKEPLR